MAVQANKTSTGNVSPVVRLKFDSYEEYMAIEREATKAGAVSVEAYIRQVLKDKFKANPPSINETMAKTGDKKDGKEKVSS